MARLAWFTPLPPERSGIAAYNAALLPLVAAAHDIEIYTATEAPLPLDGSAPPVFPAHEFAWRQLRRPYDLNVYQLGNAVCHDFIWPHLARYPGLVVLHDGQLHHARARQLLASGQGDEALRRGRDAYRAEFRYNHPDAPGDVAQLVIDALAGSIYYLYPMLRWVLRTARLVAVHGPGLARELADEHPGVEVQTVRHGMADPLDGAAATRAEALRARFGVPPGAVLFAAFGLVTPEKRIPAILRALASLPRSAHLLVAGGTVDHYHPAAEAKALDVEDRVHLTGYVPDDELDAHVAAADVCLSLRWPSGRETSGTWLRALAAGKPTVVTDLAHGAETPSLDPDTWEILPAPLARPGTGLDPVSVSVSLTDEPRQLLRAMRRLAGDAGLREALGRAARAHWSAHHTMEAAVGDYGRAIARALGSPAPRVHGLPSHLRPDPHEAARRLVTEWGVEVDILGNRDRPDART
jgi:glycosyltransferase involved in cell wall biosynthesis